MNPFKTISCTILLFLFCAITVFTTSCRKKLDPVNLCDTEECKEYYTIWKELLLERNDMSEDYFSEHISPTDVIMDSYNSGKTFRIRYNFKLEWAEISTIDQFTYYVYESAAPYPTLQIPKEKNLTKQEINSAFDLRAWASHMNVINPTEHLKYKNKRAAIQALRGNESCKFKDQNCELRADRPVEPANGNIFLNGSCTINEAANECLMGRIDLVTGERTVNETYCWIN